MVHICTAIEPGVLNQVEAGTHADGPHNRNGNRDYYEVLDGSQVTVHIK